MKTAVYLRVSSAGQAEKGTVESQRMAVREWLDRHGVEVPPRSWYVDDGVTGKRMDRPAFDELNAKLRDGVYQRVVMMELSRAGRSAVGVIKWVRDMLALKVVIVTIREGIDFSTPMGRFVATILAGIYELELETSGDRRRDGIRRYIAEGKPWGGFRSTLSPEQQRAVAEAVAAEWWPHGSVKRVAKELGVSHWIVLRARRKHEKKILGR